MFKALIPVLFLASAATVFGTTSTSVSSCGPGTLASYVTNEPAPGPGCAIDILDYSNFTYTPLSNAPLASSILLTPGSNGFDFTQVGGAPFTASGDVVKFAVYYNIFIDPAPVISGADNSLDPPVGNVNVTELFCNDSVLYPGTTSCFPPTSPAYSLTVTTASPTASITFATPAAVYQTVGIIFTLDGTNGLASFDGFSTSTTTNTTTTITPEPASTLLVGLFLLAGGYKLKKQRQS